MEYKYVHELMTSPAICCDENTVIVDVIKIFKNFNIGFLPITKNNILIGVVTDRDVLVRGFNKDLNKCLIKEIMTADQIEFVNKDTNLIDAAKIMAEKKIRRLVVLNDGKVVGVLTAKNLIKDKNLINYVLKTYCENKTLKEYSIYMNSNPHDSIKASDFPL